MPVGLPVRHTAPLAYPTIDSHSDVSGLAPLVNAAAAAAVSRDLAVLQSAAPAAARARLQAA